MKRPVVTVFGGSGFLGRHLVRRLAAKGYIIRVAVRDTEAALFLKTMGDVGQIVLLGADITDQDQVRLAVKGSDAVFNLVGILSEWGRKTFKCVHEVGAANVAKAAKDAGVERLIHVSALGANENSSSVYATSKAAGEKAVRDAFADATIVRPSVIFGPEDNFFNFFAGLARISPVLPVFGCPTLPRVTFFGGGKEDGPGDLFDLIHIDLYGEGGTRLQPVYVGDVSEALATIPDSSATLGKTFELGGPTVYSFREIMNLMLSVIGRKRLLAPVPFPVARFIAWFIERFPRPLLTRDQLRLLEHDNVVSKGASSFGELNIKPVSAEIILPTYLHRFRLPGKQDTETRAFSS